MSSIADIKLNRVDLALARHDPIQLSDNLQLTLNSYNELTIVEPRFPSYHNAIIKNRHRTVLNSKEIFSTGTILYPEAVSNLPVGQFKDVVFKDGDEFFNITAQDPIIVEHQWTSINQNTRDSSLGILFNTGELLVLVRENHNQTYNYKVKINVFETLVKLYSIPYYQGKWYVSAPEFKHLKIRYFTFHDNQLVVVDMANRITIFDCHMNVVKQIDVERDIAKLRWEKDTFLVIGKDNSLLLVEDKVREIYPPRRGHFQKVEIVQYRSRSCIIAVFMSKVVIFENGNIHEYNTDTWYTCTSVVTGRGESLTIILAYEDSTIITLSFDSNRISKISNDLSWLLFTDKTLNGFQMASEDATAEGSIILHGVQPITDKILAVVYKVLPKNALHFRIPSELSVNLTFIHLESFMGTIKEPVVNTSIAKLACFYLEDFSTIPAMIDDLTMSQSEKIDVFIPQLQVFVNELLQPQEIPAPMIKSVLEQDLVDNFVQSETVANIQFKYCLATLLLTGLESFKSSDNDMASSLYNQVKQLQTTLEESLRRYIATLLFQINKDKVVENEVDKFSLITQGSQFSLRLDALDKAVLKAGGNLVEEFEIGSSDLSIIMTNNMITSTSGHSWTLCDLTRLPIIDRKSKIDELGGFKYLYGDQNAPLVDAMRHVIDYCFISGNRIYIGQF
ncbi:hypothetical protein CANMA_004673 [Candida margitis]|uniref:uncharacterized protein n=1 Tax=Candida margitis TaxID=1775924 RepID=UPI002227B566|nr:uncharacterized protein CANMA_004673 [Candida margitis]KAI5953835.1 hypothetical protein CANMA_004673 [Candida margitis]